MAIQSIDLYKQIVEKTFVHIYWKDLNFIYMGCNARQASYIGFISPSDIVGKTDYDLFPKDDADQLRKNDEEVIKKGVPCFFEEILPGPNGKSIVYLSQKIPLFNEEGLIIGLTGLSFDITAEHHIRLEKEKAETTLANIINSLPGHVYWKDEHLVFQGCNLAQARSAGFEGPDEVIGKTDYEMPWKNEANSLRANDLEVMRSKEKLIREEVALMANSNEAFIFLSEKAPLLDKQGKVVGVLSVSFNITERKKIEEELRQAKIAAESAINAKNQFIANMSHDLRTPLTGILGMSTLLKNKALSSDEKQYVNWVHESGEQLLNLLNNILTMVTTGKESDHEVEEEAFDLYQCINDVAELEMPAIKIKKLEFLVNISPDTPHYVMADRNKIYRILLNLLGNAIKFTKEGSITIEVKLLAHEGEKVRLGFMVIDTGMGIAKDSQEKIFERFFRTKNSKQAYQGDGIGLHLVKAYIDLLDGKLNVSSELGKGSTFSFEIPIKVAENIPAKESIESSEFFENKVISAKKSPVLKKEPHILLVEDNLIALKVIENLTKEIGIQFTSVSNAELALELIKNRAFDLIITDIGLPGISGNELAQQVRSWEAKEKRKKIPIVGLTAHALQKIEQESLQSGMMKILTKPVESSSLQAVINEFCA